MTQPDKTSLAYTLADKWIEIILTNKPELLVTHFYPTVPAINGQPEAFNFNGAVNSARALAEFRQQLANALSAQYFAAPDA